MTQRAVNQRRHYVVPPQTGPLPACNARRDGSGAGPAYPGACSAVGGHDGRHINCDGSWPQDPAACSDRWHNCGMSTALLPGATLPTCPGCGTDAMRPVPAQRLTQVVAR